MDEFDSSFAQVMRRLRVETRDPLSKRVSSVTAAIVDVIEGDVSAGKVYSSVVSTLEGMLRQSADGIDADKVLDSLYTQSALLKVLQSVVPHVAKSTVQATLAPTSRVLRALISSTVFFLVDENSEQVFGTKDGLGATNNVLISTCGSVAEVLRQLPCQTDDATVRKLLNETIFLMLQDSSKPRIQKAAKEALSGVLLMKSPPCHPTIRNSITKYTNAMIDRYLKNPSQHSSNQIMVELMGFLNPALVALDFKVIGARIMTILVDLLNKQSSPSVSRPVFAAKPQAGAANILTINSILSAILSLLEIVEEEDKDESEISINLDSFAARVLASLVQINSTAVFREGAADNDLLESGRLVFGQVMLSSSQRLLRKESNAEVGAKLLPIVLQHIFGLSRPTREEGESSKGHLLLIEVSQLIRTDLQQLKDLDVNIHKKCATECLLVFTKIVGSPFDPVYAPALQPLASLLQQFPPDNDLVVDSVLSLVKLRSEQEVQEVLAFIDGALLSLVEEIGVPAFWNIISFDKLLCTQETNITGRHKYTWVFNIMKGSTVQRSKTLMAFFQNEVLPLARSFDMMASRGGPCSEMYQNLVVDLWSLFPVFCCFPGDSDQILPHLAPTIVKAMNDERYPELIQITCKGLDVLFNGIFQRKGNFHDVIECEEGASTKNEVDVLGMVTLKLLPSLFKLLESIYEKSEEKFGCEAMDTDDPKKDDGTGIVVANCITAVARFAPKDMGRNLFSMLLQRMLQTSQEKDCKSICKMCSLLSLARALVISESLEESSIILLYRVLKPLIRTDSTVARVQKLAYKLLCDVCKIHHSIFADSSDFTEILELLASSSATSQISSRYMRLKCLKIVMEGLHNSARGANYQRLTFPLVGETLLCLKDSNAKTRDVAYKLLLAICRIHDDPQGFIQTVTAAIGSSTPHMRSAAVMGLARLVFEIAPDVAEVQTMVPALLTTVLILSDDPSREVTKSMVLFIRVAISTCTPSQLEPLLPDILSGLLKNHSGKDRFRSKIKIIMKKLVKIFGYDVLMPFVPTSDSRLLTHMRKLDERELRRKRSSTHQPSEKPIGYNSMEDSDGEQDSDDGLTLVTGITRRSRLTCVTSKSKQSPNMRHVGPKSMARPMEVSRSHVSVRIKNDVNGEVMDMRELRTVTFAGDSGDGDDNDPDEEIEFDASGKLVVRDVDGESLISNLKESGKVDRLNSTYLGFSQEMNKLRNSKGIRKSEGKRKAMAPPGQVYKARKAGGDSKKKEQKYEPYAYMQLDGRSYTRKNRHQAVEQMGALVERGRKRQRR
ncbi:NUC173 domain containing protein [Nitzschia inconspicua]|uniref:NUC173 domain containing protein n=1 Tax=Nitzschia inconspicua TaxID=303405 RepID=A0A9K3L1J7_9STRA|nr:NUC173 domain containing protein [Nitzschia inconspicua]